MNDLPAPPETSGQNALELARVWVIDGALHCSLRAAAFEEPAAWGEVLADVARHVAEALAENGGPPVAETLAAIRASFAHDTGAP